MELKKKKNLTQALNMFSWPPNNNNIHIKSSPVVLPNATISVLLSNRVMCSGYFLHISKAHSFPSQKQPTAQNFKLEVSDHGGIPGHLVFTVESLIVIFISSPLSLSATS